MGFDTTKTKSNFELIPEGVYEARVVRIVELGMQKPMGKFAVDDNGRPKKPSSQLAFTFELPDVKTEIEGKMVPRLVFKQMTEAYGEKAYLSKILTSANLKGQGSWDDVLGTVVTLTISHRDNNGKTYANIAKDGIAPTSSRVAATVPEAETDMTTFTFDNPNMATFNELPNFQQDLIRGAVNFKGSKVEKMLLGQEPVTEDLVDDMDDSLDF